MINIFNQSQSCLLLWLLGICLSSLIILRISINILFPNKILKILHGKNVLITGGSSGIGLSLAKIAWLNGSNVIICGRNVDKLLKAKSEISQSQVDQDNRVHIIPLDITNSFKVLEKSLSEFSDKVDILINCAGAAVSREFCETSMYDIENQIHLNYLGSAKMTKLILPFMLKCKNVSKNVVFVSSMAGQLGLYGLASYSASKFALRGLAESLAMELTNTNVAVTLAFPPDTNTPGYEIEQVGKPETTKKLCETGGLMQPDDVAYNILRTTLHRNLFCYVGLDGFLLTQLTQGMALPDNWIQGLALVVLSPLWRLIAFGYGYWMRYVIKNNR